MSLEDIREKLALLDQWTASELEGQRLDFKAWIGRSTNDSIRMILEAAVCMANGGGGCVVVGVDDKARGCAAAIKGVPDEVDESKIKQAIAAKTEPCLHIGVSPLSVEYGTGRVLVISVPDCYTTTSDGQSWKRFEDQCMPMTPAMVMNHLEARGDLDMTARPISASLSEIISPTAMEQLRRISASLAPDDLLEQPDEQLLESLGVVREGQPTLAAVLLAGHDAAIRRFVPAYKWTFLRMSTPVDYSDRADGTEALPIALERIVDRIMVDNSIDTIQQGLLHFEYRKFPEVAIREALLNAFSHCDYSANSPITVEQHATRLIITNPGAFVGGVTPSNILRHASAARNPCLMEALLRLRLVNRTHLGVRRIYHAMLIDGKEPPVWDDSGGAVRVVMLGQRMSAEFRAFADSEARAGRPLDIEDMLILRFLNTHAEITTAAARTLTQETMAEARNRLSHLDLERGYLARGGSGKGTYWRLRRVTHQRIGGIGAPDRDNRIDWSIARSQVASALKQRANREDPSLTNADVRLITGYDRSQVKRLMEELRAEGAVILQGRGRGARYYHSCHRIEHDE